MQTSKSIIITCAGIGSRLGLNIPKCLLEINGKPLIVKHLEMLEDIPNIYVVVGFKASQVIETVRKVRDDVIFLFNHDYLTTGNTDSLTCGSWFLDEYIVSLDGDLLVSKDDFFKVYNADGEILACTKPRTRDCVFCNVQEANGEYFVTEFSKNSTQYEWSGLFQIHSSRLQTLPMKPYFIFEALISLLPIKAAFIDSMDIDTPQDYELAVSLYKDY